MAMHIALIGYGEVGRILAEDLRAQGLAVTPPTTASWAGGG
jgi:prephenate dehydrogenase